MSLLFPLFLTALAGAEPAAEPVVYPPPQPIRYPHGPMMRGEEGSAHVQFEVDGSGRITTCKVLKSSGSAELDAESCRLAERGQFRPPADASGKFTAGTYVQPVVWALPDE